MPDNKKLSRRTFLKKTTAAAVGGFLAPMIIPARALGRDGAVAPSNRIVMGEVGWGFQGPGNTRNLLAFPEVQMVAVCDVDGQRRQEAQKTVNDHYAKLSPTGKAEGCAAYNDYREMLARPDIDAVMIAVPDHWHALTYMDAARAGKDIYGEKPLSLTIGQGRQMSDTIRRCGRVFQTGSMQRSDRNFRYACELVRNGRIGKVHTVEVGLPGCGPCNNPAVEPVPEWFDYDRWLGPAPWAPYTEKRCHFQFRYILDYSGGHVTDWGAHHCDIAQWGLGTEYTGPVEVEGKGEFPKDGLYDVATKFHFDCRYANGIVMKVSSENPSGAKFIGDEGWVYVDRGKLEASSASLLHSVIGPNEIHLYESNDHFKNFLDCMRSRGETIAPIEVAHRSITIAHLGNISMRLGRKVQWDPDRERFINDPEADRMLNRPMRSPWHL